ncbi:hypothetical protein [Alphaspiravirus yamagawaense]|uniref:Uncharacterized protein n=1 Tax=Alphaspiravirus yamagawaense TaxID=1157339 RepID=J7Q323_9VIRU|nr:hypothetical protein [Aeropyrum coil-shaped virus]CCG27823.1 hypothetical protein [Aeropyrum coil-shaped virus]
MKSVTADLPYPYKYAHWLCVSMRAKSMSYEDRLEAARQCLAEGKTIGIVNLFGLKQPLDSQGYRYRFDGVASVVRRDSRVEVVTERRERVPETVWERLGMSEEQYRLGMNYYKTTAKELAGIFDVSLEEEIEKLYNKAYGRMTPEEFGIELARMIKDRLLQLVREARRMQDVLRMLEERYGIRLGIEEPTEFIRIVEEASPSSVISILFKENIYQIVRWYNRLKRVTEHVEVIEKAEESLRTGKLLVSEEELKSCLRASQS